MAEDKYEVDGFKSWAITKGIKYIASKIDPEDYEDMLDKVADYFPEKDEVKIFIEIRNMLGEAYLVTQERIQSLQKKEPKREVEQEPTETPKKVKRSRNKIMARNKKTRKKP